MRLRVTLDLGAVYEGGVAKRWLIDAMNLIGSRPDGWWNDRDRAMRRMVAELDDFAERTGDEVTAVFDRAPRDGLDPQRIEVRFARWKGRNAADHEIEVIVEAEPAPESLLVVTSDKQLAEKVRSLGATVVGSGDFLSTLERGRG